MLHSNNLTSVSMNELLNPYQKASLVTVLRMFEESLRQAQEWLSGRTESGILYYRKLDLSEEKQTTANKKIQDTLEQINILVKKLDLQPVEENPGSSIRGQLAVSWANLIDSQSNKLKRYGEVDPDLAELLDKEIIRLAGSAFHLAQFFSNNDAGG